MAIASLAVRVSADTKPYTRGMKETTGPAKKLERQMTAIGKRAGIMAGAITLTGAAMTTALTKHGLESVDAQAKLARQLDGTIDGLRGLQLAGSDAGVDVNTLNKDVEKLTSRLGEAMRGTGEAADALDRLGLNAEDLAEMDVDERIATIADRMHELDMSAAEAGDTLRDFGVRNGQVINLMRQGGDAIRNARQEVDTLGLSLSEVDAAKVEAANDAMARIGSVSEGVSNQLAVSLSPALTAVANQIVKQFSDASGSMQSSLNSAVDFGVEAFADVLTAAATTADFINANPIASKFGVLGWVMLGPKGLLMGAVIGATFEMIEEGLAQFGVGITDAEDKARRLLGVQEQIADQEQLIAKRAEIMGDNLAPDDPFIAQALAELNELKNVHADLEAEVNSSTEAQEALNTLLKEGEESGTAFSNAIREVVEALLASRDASFVPTVDTRDISQPETPEIATGDQQEDPEVIAEQNKRDKMLSIYQDYADQRMASGENFRQTDLQKQEEYQASLVSIDNDAMNARLSVARGMFSNLSTLMESEYRKEFEIGKVAAKAQALIDGYQAVQSSYAAGAKVGGPVLGAAFAATAATATALQLRKINNTSFNGGGGSTPTAPPSEDPTANVPQSVTNNNTSNNVTLNVTGSGDPQSIITALEEFFGNDGIAINSDTAQAQVLRG